MKEYLTKNSSGEYQLVNHRFSNDDIEIPEGKNYAYKNDLGIHFTSLEMGYRDSVLVWQRHPTAATDNVNQPQHYCSHPSGIECIEITRHHDFAVGNAIKYLWRAGLKSSDTEIQDLKKAVWYLQDKIKQLESKSG